MRRGLVSLALLVSSGAGALACEPDALLHPVRLSPDRSARDYLPQPPRPGLILYPQAPAPSPLGAPHLPT